MSLPKIMFSALVVSLLLVAPSRPVSAQSDGPRPATELVGLWKAERDFGPEVQGTLTILQRGNDWSAEIAGYIVPLQIKKNRINFEIPGDRGAFKGMFSQERDSITGHWVQPTTAANYVPFASPVYLQSEGPGVWQGEVRPLEDKMTFYLPLWRNDDGTVSGILRNPEANFGRFFPIKEVVIAGDYVGFLEHGREGIRLAGIYDSNYDVFPLFIPDAGGSFDFWRETDDAASHFYPRPKTDPPYTYHPPLPTGDGWEVASLQDVGMAVGPIEDLMRRIIATPMDSIASLCIHAVLIARHGKLVVEEYFHGYTAGMPHETRSAAKGVTSTLAGIAINNGAPLSLSTPVYDLMYDGHPPSGLDRRAERMTLQHLLTMTSGLACDDHDPASPGQEETMQFQTEQPDWAQYTLDLPMAHEPGEHAAYCSASPNLAAAMVRKATDSWLPEFYRENFAEPMQMGLYHMNLMPNGEAYGGGGLYIKGRDFLKMGQLFLDGGFWKGKRLLSDDFVRDAVSPVVQLYGQAYGYMWWQSEFAFNDGTVRTFFVGGNGGQYLIDIPELEIAIVIFGGNYGLDISRKAKQEYVQNHIVKAVELGEE